MVDFHSAAARDPATLAAVLPEPSSDAAQSALPASAHRGEGQTVVRRAPSPPVHQGRWAARAAADLSIPDPDAALPARLEPSEWVAWPAEPDVPDHALRVLPGRRVSLEQLPYEAPPRRQPARYAPAEPLVRAAPERPASAQSATPQSTAGDSPASVAGSVRMPAEDVIPAAAPASLLPEGGPEPLLPRAFLLSSR